MFFFSLTKTSALTANNVAALLDVDDIAHLALKFERRYGE